MGFGLTQISNPTPSIINLWARVITVVCGVFLAWMSTNDIVTPYWNHLLSGILGLVLALTNGLAPLFGVQISQSNVPTENVTAIDTDKQKTDK